MGRVHNFALSKIGNASFLSFFAGAFLVACLITKRKLYVACIFVMSIFSGPEPIYHSSPMSTKGCTGQIKGEHDTLSYTGVI